MRQPATFTKHLHTKHACTLVMIVFHFLLMNTCGVTLVVQAQEVRKFTKPLPTIILYNVSIAVHTTEVTQVKMVTQYSPQHSVP